ncbi:MAG: hypothetical protein Q7K55_09500 [Candidatus Levybacteria bacterium]|nr:hypothetical protein [Candidatus Levybacteria bacterium]
MITNERSQFGGEEQLWAENPLVTALTPYLPKIAELNKDYFNLQIGHQDFIINHYGFLVDAIAGLDGHSLEPASILNVFPWIMNITSSGVPEDILTNERIVSSYLRKAVIQIASAFYAVHGMEGENWQKLPGYYFENRGEFSSNILDDKKGIDRYNSKVEEFRVKTLTEISKIKEPLWYADIVRDVFANGRVRSIIDH